MRCRSATATWRTVGWGTSPDEENDQKTEAHRNTWATGTRHGPCDAEKRSDEQPEIILHHRVLPSMSAQASTGAGTGGSPAWISQSGDAIPRHSGRQAVRQEGKKGAPRRGLLFALQLCLLPGCIRTVVIGPTPPRQGINQCGFRHRDMKIGITLAPKPTSVYQRENILK